MNRITRKLKSIRGDSRPKDNNDGDGNSKKMRQLRKDRGESQTEKKERRFVRCFERKKRPSH